MVRSLGRQTIMPGTPDGTGAEHALAALMDATAELAKALAAEPDQKEAAVIIASGTIRGLQMTLAALLLDREAMEHVYRAGEEAGERRGYDRGLAVQGRPFSLVSGGTAC
jgi:hypothetical protein